MSVVLSNDDVCLQTSGDASINQEESNDEEVLNSPTEEEDEEYNCSQPTSQDSPEVQEENVSARTNWLCSKFRFWPISLKDSYMKCGRSLTRLFIHRILSCKWWGWGGGGFIVWLL